MERKFELAGYRRRLSAIIFDQIVTEIFAGFITILLLAIVNTSNVIFNLYFGIFSYYAFVICLDFINNVVLAKFTNGKSIGKAIFNERIISLNGEKLTFITLLVRWIVYNVLTLGFGWVGLLVNFLVLRTRDLKQGLHDSVSETIVVRSKTSLNNRLSLITLLLVGLLFSCTIGLFCSYSLISTIGNESINQYDFAEGLDQA